MRGARTAVRLAFFADRVPRSRQGRDPLAEALLAVDQLPGSLVPAAAELGAGRFRCRPRSAPFLDRFGHPPPPRRPCGAAGPAALGRQNGPSSPDARPSSAAASRPSPQHASRCRRSTPDVDRAIAAVPAAAQDDAGSAVRPAAMAAEQGQRWRGAGDSARSAEGVGAARKMVESRSSGPSARRSTGARSSWPTGWRARPTSRQAAPMPRQNGWPDGWR